MLVVFFSFSVVISTKNNAFVAVCQTFIYSVSLSVCLSVCLSARLSFWPFGSVQDYSKE